MVLKPIEGRLFKLGQKQFLAMITRGPVHKTFDLRLLKYSDLPCQWGRVWRGLRSRLRWCESGLPPETHVVKGLASSLW